MAEENTAAPDAAGDGAASTPDSALDVGTYEVLSTRLADFATELTGRAETLNAARTEAFGSTELRLAGTTRIRTANNCVPRDMVQVGGHLLFGYNVHMGLKSHTDVGDVFALHEFAAEDGKFSFAEVEQAGHVLDDA
ncbi:DNA repair ATPase, partial [Glycomyces tenuis]